MVLEDPITARIVDFIQSIGIPVTLEKTPQDTFLPGILIRSGGLVFNPENLPYPGDLLHEAGHIAVTEPAQRDTLNDVPSNPAEEMAAMAWSYAAARAIELDPAIVFHPHGYKGGSEALLAAYDASTGPGIPMLAYFGMSTEPARAAALGREPFPAMTRWLR